MSELGKTALGCRRHLVSELIWRRGNSTRHRHHRSLAPARAAAIFNHIVVMICGHCVDGRHVWLRVRDVARGARLPPGWERRRGRHHRQRLIALRLAHLRDEAARLLLWRVGRIIRER